MNFNKWLYALFILFFAFALYSSSFIINIHEKAHCIGAHLTGRNCNIVENKTSIDRLIYQGDYSIFIYSGMPYIIMTLMSLLLFLTKKRWEKSEFKWVIHLILVLFLCEFIINLASWNVKGDDFNNIFGAGSLVELIGINVVVADFFILFILSIAPNLDKIKSWRIL